MRNTLNTILLIGLIGLSGSAIAESESSKEINHLLEYIAASECTFVRDKERFDGAQWEEFMSKEYHRDRRHIHTADNFIDRVASDSVETGTPYTVKCEDQELETTDIWLHKELAIYRNLSDPYRDR